MQYLFDKLTTMNYRWFAGYFDAKGCITRNSSNTILCKIQTVDKIAAQAFFDVFKGNFSSVRNKYWRWAVERSAARDFLVSIKPHLVVKKPQAEEAIGIQNLFDEINERRKRLGALIRGEITE